MAITVYTCNFDKASIQAILTTNFTTADRVIINRKGNTAFITIYNTT